MSGNSTSLSENEATRSLLDQLLSDSRLYTNSKDYKDLLDFVVRLRNFAPFNAMLLQVQKPGLSYAASSYDWQERFGRRPKAGARPLLILWPFGPVALVYDVMDTEGKLVPEDVACFVAHGDVKAKQLASFRAKLSMKNIEWIPVDAGDRKAGSIQVVKRAATDKDHTIYQIQVNQNHSPPAQFATVVHELGHLFLGHLGPDEHLKVCERARLEESQRELEAESVSYVVCKRNGVESKAESYLANFVAKNTTLEDLDVYRIMRAAGQVEILLGLGAHIGMPRPVPIPARL